MTLDWWFGALWTLIAVAFGTVLGLVLAVIFLADRGGPDDEQDPPDPDPWWDDFDSAAPISSFFEARLLP